MESSVTLHLESTFDAMLSGKLTNFLKRSLWRYLLSSAVIALAYPQLFGSLVSTFFALFSGLCCISMIVIYFSSKVQSEKYAFDADVEFFDSKIIIKHRNKDLVEEKDWSWVKSLKPIEDVFIFQVNEEQPLIIIFSKAVLNQNQINFFEKKEIIKNKMF